MQRQQGASSTHAKEHHLPTQRCIIYPRKGASSTHAKVHHLPTQMKSKFMPKKTYTQDEELRVSQVTGKVPGVACKVRQLTGLDF